MTSPARPSPMLHPGDRAASMTRCTSPPLEKPDDFEMTSAYGDGVTPAGQSFGLSHANFRFASVVEIETFVNSARSIPLFLSERRTSALRRSLQLSITRQPCGVGSIEKDH